MFPFFVNPFERLIEYSYKNFASSQSRERLYTDLFILFRNVFE